jgi:cytochrome c-type biogenesis protein CcsB
MKIFKFLFSGAFMGILLLAFAYAIGYATFVENDYGAVAAKVLVYNSKWFELLLLLMVINFAGMIFTKHLYLRSKWNILAIHVALIIIIIGAGVTRYYGYEGTMHIRNGQTTNEFRSSDTFLQVQFGEGDDIQTNNSKFFLTTVRSKLIEEDYSYNNKPYAISINDYYENAAIELVRTEDGMPYMVVETRDGGRINLKYGESLIAGGILFSFGEMTKPGQVQFTIVEGELMMLNTFAQSDSTGTSVNEPIPLEIRTIYTAGNQAYRVASYMDKAEIQYKEATDNSPGIPIVRLKINDFEELIPVGSLKTYTIDGNQISVRVGTRTLLLPFKLKLEKFDLERYPGSNSPSSFASDVIVIDKDENEEFPYRIYMNHILNYGGFRFFQSSYDQDEQGTVLSVNQDIWGTRITYFGYFLLFATLIISFFTKTRFKRITLQLQDVHDKRKKLGKGLAMLLMLVSFAGTAFSQGKMVDKDHASEFGKLLVQSKAGRIEPINTLSTKMLVKISKKSSYNGYTADQVVLGIAVDPERWENEPIIKVPESAIQNLIGVSGDLASFKDFLTENGQYKIGQQVEAAYQKKPALRSTLDKGLINVDERVNVFYGLLNASEFRIFPLENDPNNTWVSPPVYHEQLGHGSGNADLFEDYTRFVKEALISNSYTDANRILGEINQLQQQLGAEILPSKTKASIEILYNKVNIFKTLFPVYLMLGIFLVGIFLIQIFYPNLEFRIIGKILLYIMVVSFALQTLGLGARWYIAGHAPWSNGYESMIYISWATVLAGFLFMKRSSATLGVTALLAGITLLTAHMSWLNPEVTNLVPVLKSYWLTFHVATITASYGFLALGCMLGFLNLCIMIFRTKSNMENVNLTLKELMLITEMSLAVGLVLLVIGNFLGGIWANESWGRYWGWDPKETWTLVTVILYSFTLHLTLIPAIRTTFIFSFFSFISFGAVLMTYFGVNYYLSGLHSYADGDPVAIPNYVFYALGVIGIISVFAAYNDFKFTKLEETE